MNQYLKILILRMKINKGCFYLFTKESKSNSSKNAQGPGSLRILIIWHCHHASQVTEQPLRYLYLVR